LSLGLLQTLNGGSPAPSADSVVLDQREISHLEPHLGHLGGALLHKKDGAVDPVALHGALRKTLAAHSRVRLINTRVEALQEGPRATVIARGKRVEFDRVVLAAGAWVSKID